MPNLQVIGPVSLRTFDLEKKCQENEQHAHNYDHTTIVVAGGIKVFYEYEDKGETVKGESGEYHQGEAVCIKAGVRHTVKALVDNTKYMCIFSHRDLDGLITQSYVGNEGATI